MPPKKTSSGASKKTEIKKKEKIIEVKKFLYINIFWSVFWKQTNILILFCVFRIKRLD